MFRKIDPAVLELFKLIGGLVFCIVAGLMLGHARAENHKQRELARIERFDAGYRNFPRQCRWHGNRGLGSEFIAAKCLCIEDAIRASGYRERAEIGMYLSVFIIEHRRWKSRNLDKTRAALDLVAEEAGHDPYLRRVGYLDTVIEQTRTMCTGFVEDRLTAMKDHLE